MGKRLSFTSGGSQTGEGHGHLNKTLQCGWAGALVEVLQDAVDNREEARESTGPGGEAWKEVSEERLCRGHDMSLGWIFFFFFFFFAFLGLHLLYTEVPRLGVESELQPRAYSHSNAGSKPCL